MTMRMTAREFLRAIRGRRSQQAFSRRLGYASNVVVKWEAGRRMPSAAEALRACRRAGIDVQGAFNAFGASTAPLLGAMTDGDVAAWLAAQRGAQPLSAVAQRTGLSRYRVARFLAAETRPRLPELFALIEAMTGRLSELVAALVAIEQVPSLLASYARVRASREAALLQPWSSAVLALLATGRFSSSPRSAAEIARTLGIDREPVQRSIELLRAAGVVGTRKRKYEVTAALVIDTRNEPAAAGALRSHWASASSARLASPRDADLFSYHVFAVSRADYAQLRDLQLDFYRRARALAVASEPTEVAGQMTLHQLRWDPDEALPGAHGDGDVRSATSTR